MNFTAHIAPAAGGYYTQEQLYALCVLLCWGPGLSLPDDLAGKSAVNLHGMPKGNTGLSVYLLQNNPNATNLIFSAGPNNSYENIFFKVLGVPLVVQFDEDGVGRVSFVTTETL
jgi:hypothetical protein